MYQVDYFCITDVISIFKTSNDSRELAYYWKVYRDNTGRKIRPIFKDYVLRMNRVAESENFTDAGDMWRYAFEDNNFVESVDRIWKEIKPLYDLLHGYVRAKLKEFYKNDLPNGDNNIPAHILGMYAIYNFCRTVNLIFLSRYVYLIRYSY